MSSDVSSPAPEAGTSKALLSVIVLCFGGLSESAFRVCFVVGAAAAFLGMLIAAAVPLSRRRDENRAAAAGATPEEHVAAASR